MNLKPWLLAPILACVALCSAMTEAQSGWKLFFDPSLETPQLRLTSSEQNRIVGDAYVLLSRVQKLCASNSTTKPAVLGAAQGSFTRPQSKQMVYSVLLCSKPSFDPSFPGSITTDFLYGLFLYEGGRLLDSFTSKISDGMYSTRDINQNGLSEIVYLEETSAESGLQIVTNLDLFVTEFDSRGNLKRIGQRPSVQRWDQDGTGFEYVISVAKGQKPVFKADIKTLDVSSNNPVVVGMRRNIPISILF
jgi:hypothetical protein